jgi:hypothetical protein
MLAQFCLGRNLLRRKGERYERNNTIAKFLDTVGGDDDSGLLE